MAKLATLTPEGLVSGVRVSLLAWREMTRRDPCPYCVVAEDHRRALDRELNIEHVVPLSRGGPRGWENSVRAHRVCNSARGNRGLLIFLMERRYKAETLNQPWLTKKQVKAFLREWRRQHPIGETNG